MSNTNVAVKGNTLPASLAGIAGIAQSVAAVGGAGEAGVAFMAFRKTGEWEYGLEDIEADPNGTWLVNPGGILHGWVAWPENRGGGPAGEVLVPTSQPLPSMADLPDVGCDWGKVVSIPMAALTGEDADDDVQVVFKTGSKGGLKAYAQLMTAFIARYNELDLDERQDVYPIVHLGESSYKHPKYGKIFTPVFEVAGWADVDGEEFAPPKKARKKKAAKAAAPAPEPEEQEQEEAPKPTRRRRKAAR